jgi:hypothetical protein
LTPLLDTLTEDDLAKVAPFRWQSRPDRTVADAVAWVNAELMKNAAASASCGSCVPPRPETARPPLARRGHTGKMDE